MPNCKWDGKPFEPDPRAVRYDENGAPVSTKEFCSTACRQAFYRVMRASETAQLVEKLGEYVTPAGKVIYDQLVANVAFRVQERVTT
jgi:hypothetical protein